MKDLTIKIVANVDADADTYYTASTEEYPGIVGGGNTPVEATNELFENIRVYEEWQKEFKDSTPVSTAIQFARKKGLSDEAIKILRDSLDLVRAEVASASFLTWLPTTTVIESSKPCQGRLFIAFESGRPLRVVEHIIGKGFVDIATNRSVDPQLLAEFTLPKLAPYDI